MSHNLRFPRVLVSFSCLAVASAAGAFAEGEGVEQAMSTWSDRSLPPLS
jgi:hypothetical protein